MIIKQLFNIFNQNKKKAGTRVAIQAVLQKIVGVDDSIKTLHYFLNELHTPTSIKTKDPDLRIMQICDAQLLKIFHCFCMKHQLRYWLDYGTLLGAVRHGGFIPWDDDMDVAMPREDYNTFYDLAKKELAPLGLTVEERLTGRIIGLSYKHMKTGIWLDIFPVDIVKSSLSLDKAFPYISKGFKTYRKHYARFEKKRSEEFLHSKRKKYIDDKLPQGKEFSICYHGPEFIYPKIVCHNEEDIFPLVKIEYEGSIFLSPNKADIYLKGIYGNNYMKFPLGGIFHHGGEALCRPPLSEWAKINNIDMRVISNELDEIQRKING